MAGVSFSVPSMPAIKLAELPDNQKTLTNIMQMYARMQQMQARQLAMQRAASRGTGSMRGGFMMPFPDPENPGKTKYLPIYGGNKDVQNQQIEYYRNQALGQIVANDKEIQQKLAQLDTLDVRAAEKVLKDIRNNDAQRISQATGVDAGPIIDAIMKQPKDAVAARRKAIEGDSGLNAIWESTKANMSILGDTLKALVTSESAEEKRARGERAQQLRAEARAASPYLEDQARREAAGEGVFERLKDTGSVLTNLGLAAVEDTLGLGTNLAGGFGGRAAGRAIGKFVGSFIPVPGASWGASEIGEKIGGWIGGAVGGGMGMAPATEQSFLEQVASDPRLSKQQQVQAIEEGAGMAKALGFGLGAAVFPGVEAGLARVLPIVRKAPVTRGLASYALRDVPVTAIEGAALGAGGQAGQNYIFGQSTGIDTPIMQNVGDAALHGAMAAPVFGAIRQAGRKGGQKQTAALTNIPARDAENAAVGTEGARQAEQPTARPGQKQTAFGTLAPQMEAILNVFPMMKHQERPNQYIQRVKNTTDIIRLLEDFKRAGGTKDMLSAAVDQLGMNNEVVAKLKENKRVIGEVIPGSKETAQRLKKLIQDTEVAAYLDDAVSVRDDILFRLNSRLKELEASQYTPDQKDVFANELTKQFFEEGGTLEQAKEFYKQTNYAEAKLNGVASDQRLAIRKFSQSLRQGIAAAINEKEKSPKAGDEVKGDATTKNTQPTPDGGGDKTTPVVEQPVGTGERRTDPTDTPSYSGLEATGNGAPEATPTGDPAKTPGGDPANKGGGAGGTALQGKRPAENPQTATVPEGAGPNAVNPDGGPGSGELATGGEKPTQGAGGNERTGVRSEGDQQPGTTAREGERLTPESFATNQTERTQIPSDQLYFDPQPTDKGTRTQAAEALKQEADGSPTPKVKALNGENEKPVPKGADGGTTVAKNDMLGRILSLSDEQLLQLAPADTPVGPKTPGEIRAILMEGLEREAFGEPLKNDSSRQKQIVEAAHKMAIPKLERPGPVNETVGPPTPQELLSGMPFDFWGKHFSDLKKKSLSVINSALNGFAFERSLSPFQTSLKPSNLAKTLDLLTNASNKAYDAMLKDALNKNNMGERDTKLSDMEKSMLKEIYGRGFSEVALPENFEKSLNDARAKDPSIKALDYLRAEMKPQETIDILFNPNC